MKNLIIPIPRNLSGKKIGDLFEEATNYKNQVNTYDRITFDVSNCGFVNPAGVLLMSAFRDVYKEVKPDIETYIRYRTSNKVTKALQSFGFLKVEELLNDDYVKSLAEYSVPIQRCHTTDQCLETHSQIMSQVKNRTKSSDNVYATIDYILNEIWDNAGTHGYKCYYTEDYPKPIYFQAFSYRTGVEIAILDLGQGIANSLRTKKQFQKLSVDQILKKAIEESVTGHPNNSPGFGLFSSSELIKSNSGELHIWSSGRSISVNGNSTRTGKGGFYDGTLVYLKVNAEIDSNFEEIMRGRNVENYLEDHQISI